MDDWQERTLSIDEVVARAARWFLPITILSLGPYLLLWGLPPLHLPEGFFAVAGVVLKWGVIALLVYAASALLHEFLHVLAMFGAGVRPRDVRYGFRLREGFIFVHADRPMRARAYRGVLMLPAIAQGVLPLFIGTAAGVGWLVLYGYVMLYSAVGDLAVLRLIRDLPGGAAVKDHPSAVGCLVRSGG